MQPAGPCTRSDSLAAGASYPPITLTVNVAFNAPATVINRAAVSSDGAVNSVNATSTDATTILPPPVLSIAKTHSGNFVQGQTGAVYTVTVSNTGTTPTIGTVAVVENPPAGLSVTAMSGAGWMCAPGGCVRSDTLAGGASYPPITVTVNVAANASSPQVNQVSVSGCCSAAAEASATDSTTIVSGTCLIVLSPTGATLPATGTSTAAACPNASQPACGFYPETPQSFTVTPSPACGAWTAVSSNVGFVQVTAGGTGNGTGMVSFTAFTNTHNSSRSAAITVASGSASAVFTITETGLADSLAYRQVYALYEQILDRDPDAPGFAFWTGQGAAGLGQMADSFLTSPEAFNNAFTVIVAYQAALGQPPRFAQFAAALDAIHSGTQTESGLFDTLAGPGFTAAALYMNLLGRQPQASETTAFNTNGALAAFENIIGYPAASSPIGAANNEFQSTGSFHTDHTNALYIDLLYFTILDRDPDQGGFAFWTGIANAAAPGLLFQGAAGFPARIQIVGPGTPGQGFIGSAEFQGLFAN